MHVPVFVFWCLHHPDLSPLVQRRRQEVYHLSIWVLSGCTFYRGLFG